MKKLKIPRSLVLLIVFFIMFSILIVRLFQLQIVKGQEYENNFILQTKREIVLSGARGNIYDRNGKPLATNKLANSVTFEDQETYNSDRERQLNLNSKIYQMIRIIKSKGDSIETSLKIIIDPNGNYQFSVDDFWLQRFKADAYGKANIDDMEAKERNSTADEIVSYLSDKFCVFSQGEKQYTDKEKKDYGLPQEFEKSDLLDILNIRYELSLHAYQKYLSVTVAKDVSDETVAAIMENQYDISGVDIKQDTIRVYEGGEACSSILGYTGTISSEELKERNVTTLANEGTSFQLSLIDKIDGVETRPKVESQIEIDKISWEGVHAGMELYAQSTGIFDGFPISVAGKSGTAQEVKNRPDHGLFIGYAPADNPEIAVAVRIVNGYAAGNAVECGKNIFEYYFGIE